MVASDWTPKKRFQFEGVVNGQFAKKDSVKRLTGRPTQTPDHSA
jgi:hypothetical protein